MKHKYAIPFTINKNILNLKLNKETLYSLFQSKKKSLKILLILKLLHSRRTPQ